MLNNQQRFLALSSLIFMVILLKLVPHMPHQVPFLALFLLMGRLGLSLKWVMPLALLGYAITDWTLGFYPGWEMNYLALALTLVMGQFYQPTWSRSLFFGLSSSLVFFVLSNLGVFWFTQLYPQNWAGLELCFTMALPFYPWTFVSNTLALMVVSALAQSLAWERITQSNWNKN